MTNEAKLISAAIQTRDLSALFERGVTDSWFPDQDDRRIWVFLRSHFSKYGECPSLEVVSENFPTYQVPYNNCEWRTQSFKTLEEAESMIVFYRSCGSPAKLV